MISVVQQNQHPAALLKNVLREGGVKGGHYL